MFGVKSKSWLLAVMLSPVMALAACGANSGSGGVGAGHFKVGVILPTSGALADTYGASYQSGLDYVFDKINDRGGIKCEDGSTHKVTTKVYDDAMTPDVAQSAARSALDDRNQLIVGPIGSATASAVQ